MKPVMLFMILVSTANWANAQELNIWGHPVKYKEPPFGVLITDHSHRHTKEQIRREKLDRTTHKVKPAPKIIKEVAPLNDSEVHFQEMVRANLLREGRLIPNVNSFDVLVRHRNDRNFQGSALQYRFMTGNKW